VRVVSPHDLVRWLASADLDDPGGHCLSWWNPSHRGYAYPEISGLLLRLLSLAGVAAARRQSLRRALLRDYDAGRAVRREAQSYTFDTAMALAGLLTQMHADGDAVGDAVAGRAARGWTSVLITAACRADPAAGQGGAGQSGPGRPAAGTRWSMAFGAHQAKVCGALLQAERILGPQPGLTDAITACAGAALDVQEDDGRFRIHAASPMTYAHSHCYAVEGLLMCAASGLAGHWPRAAAGAAWLAAAQQPDGSVAAWHDGHAASGPPRADATAQALRIWTLTDRDRFAGPAARARMFLAGLWVSPRGLRYEPGSGDLNAWATIFAAQALGWQADPATADAARIV
jgi:hypothetical protein